MPLAQENCRYELPQVMQRVVALAVIRIYLIFMGSLLLIANTSTVIFVFAGTREFPAITMHTLFS